MGAQRGEEPFYAAEPDHLVIGEIRLKWAITAVYNGDSDFLASTAAALTQIVLSARQQVVLLIGQVKPTAHSPPIPSAARKRKISSCHHAWATNERPVNNA